MFLELNSELLDRAEDDRCRLEVILDTATTNWTWDHKRSALSEHQKAE